jgi:hypothetical protein
MKTTSISTFIAIALLTTGTTFAQGGQGRRGAGYGGPPRTEAERSARQEQCQQANVGVCPNNGVCDGTGKGQGKNRGQGQGKGQRRGPRDGSGPRGGNTNCPLAN